MLTPMERLEAFPDTIVEHLHARLIPEPNSGCWLWLGPVNQDGYGLFATTLGSRQLRFSASAHRLAWRIKNGPIPNGMYVCHRCDVPACCNADHLFLGTQLENVRDMDAKGRSRRVGVSGKANRAAKLDEAAVRAILLCLDQGETVKTLAKTFGVGEGTIYDIKNGHRWTDVTGRIGHRSKGRRATSTPTPTVLPL